MTVLGKCQGSIWMECYAECPRDILDDDFDLRSPTWLHSFRDWHRICTFLRNFEWLIYRISFVSSCFL